MEEPNVVYEPNLYGDRIENAPYKEMRLRGLVKANLNSRTPNTLAKMRKINDKIKDIKSAGLKEFLDLHFDLVHIEGDGNCGPRAISFCLYGHTEHHKEIRKNICEIRYKRM